MVRLAGPVLMPWMRRETASSPAVPVREACGLTAYMTSLNLGFRVCKVGVTMPTSRWLRGLRGVSGCSLQHLACSGASDVAAESIRSQSTGRV